MMNNFAKLVIAVAMPIVVGGLSGLATSRAVSTWYPTLVKPSFKPPSWIFSGSEWSLEVSATRTWATS
jgi:tryptophan-rich sensory protein